jgi:methyltransferase (TIGR00027 family)
MKPMEEGRYSATAEGCAILRALHQSITADSKILDDPISPRLVDPDGGAYREVLNFLQGLPSTIRLRLTHHLLRGRYAEDCLAEAFIRGLRQYVILGAGLETFAYRQSAWARNLAIFEVDHPATQTWKRGRLSGANIAVPENTVFVPVNFETTTLRDALPKAGFDRAAPAFFAMLGVSQYLTGEALDETLTLVQEMVPSSEIVFSFVPPEEALPDDEATLTRQFAQSYARIGEPWLTRPTSDHLRRKLQRMEFAMVEHLSPEAANLRYFQSRQDGLNAPAYEQMMRAMV